MSGNNKAVFKKIRRESIDYSQSPGIANMNPLISALNNHDIVSETETTTTTTSALLIALPKTVRIFILSFLGETQEELRELPLVSKQFYKDCKEPGIEWKLIPLFVLRPKINNEDEGRTMNFVHTMNQYQQDENTNRKLQRYNICKVENMEKFDQMPEHELFYSTKNLAILRQMEWKGIRSLDMSSLQSTTMVPMNTFLPRALARIMPNLHELNLSHTNFNKGSVPIDFSICCDQLEKIVWTNIHIDVDFYLDGTHIKYAANLKEINMDDSNFKIVLGQEEEAMSDLNNHRTIYIFSECKSQVLERVSIRNAKYHKNDHTSGIISQKMLIKFIRNAPATLKWFRSDLTQVNIEMLTKERPGIQYLN